jgi:hypothetical protein
MSDFLKICSLGAELFHAYEQANMTKVTVAFLSFAKAPKKEYYRNLTLNIPH